MPPADLVVAVRTRSEWHMRIVAALSAHSRVRRVISVSRPLPSSWGEGVSRERSPVGADVVIDPESGDPGIHVSFGDARSGITNASSQGLARALATRSIGSTPVWTEPGNPVSGGEPYAFPAPIGVVRSEDGRAPIGGDLAACGAFGAQSTLAVVDDRRFLDGVCAAAGALIAYPAPTAPIPVWDRPEMYISACEELGLVVASTE